MPLNHTSQYAQLTDDHFSAIGRITVEWSNIEFLLGVLLSRLLVTPEFLARSYTDQMTAVKLQDAINEGVDIQRQRYGCRLIQEDALEQISTINGKVTQMRATRNKFAHFCWSRSSDDTIFGTNLSGGIPDSKKHQRSFVTYSVSQLKEFHKIAYDLVDELSTLIEKLPEMEEDGLTSKVTKRNKTG